MMQEERSKEHFITDESKGWETVGEGVKRKLMAYDDRLMMVKVAFEKEG